MNRKFKAILAQSLLLWFVFLPIGKMQAQIKAPELSEFPNKKILEDRVILNVLKDSKGFLWIGCTDGILRYDGYELEIFTASPGDSTKLQANYGFRLFEDSQGLIWIGGHDYISFFDYNTGHFTSFWIPRDEVASVRDIIEDSKNQIWFAVQEGYGRVSVDSGIKEFIQFESPLNALLSTLPSFYRGEDAHVWLVTDKEETQIRLPNDIKRRRIGTESSKYIKLFKKHGLAYPPKVFEDGNGNYWYYGKDYPVYFWNGQENDEPILLLKNYCWGIQEDRNGNIWLAMNNGIYVHETERLPISSHLYKKLYVTATIQDSSGGLWVGAREGVLKFNEHQNNDFVLDEAWSFGNSPKNIRALYIDSKHNLWASAINGIYRLNNEKQQFEHLNYPIVGNQNESSDSSYIYNILDVKGEMYFASRGGVYKLDEENKQFHVLANIPNTVSIASTENGELWAGGGSGLYRLTGGNYKYYTAQPGINGKLQDNGIASINPDQGGDLWIATFGGGVSYYESKSDRFRTFNQNNGLITSNTYDIIKHNEQVWVSHLKGLSILKPDSSGFINLTKANGLPIAEMNRNPFSQSKSGRMFAGGPNGWFTFHPDSLNFQTNLHAPSILNWQINYEPVSVSDRKQVFNQQSLIDVQNVNLYPNHRTISFELSAMNILRGDQIKYAFRLMGYEDKWIEVSAKGRRITYTNLPVGNYIFQAKATNEFGIWSDEVKEVAIEVHPSFTQTLGFKVLIFLSIGGLIAGLAYAFQRQRYLKKIRKMETQYQLQMERQRISRDLHDNIGAQLTNIATKLEITAYQAGKAQSGEAIQERIERVGDEARITIGLLRETIWAIQQDSFTLNEFANKIQQHLERNISQPTTYQFDFQASELSESRSLNANQALNLFRIFQEAIQNILKHAKAKEVSVKLEVTQSGVNLTIQDDGLGMNLDSARQKVNHYGLKNMQARAQEIDGNIEIESELDKGVLINISLLNAKT